MISSAMNARVPDAAENLPRSSVPMSHVYNITVRAVGRRYMHGPAESTTNRSSRKVPIVHGRYHFAGVRNLLVELGRNGETL